ncbi:MAG: universal stress protein [Acidimicrobiales bacterium]
MSSFDFTRGGSWAGRPIVRRLGDARERSRIVAAGTIRSTETIAVSHASILRCVLCDGSGQIDLLFGRSTVPGIKVGSSCTIEGTVGRCTGRLTVWNPRYRLEVAGAFEATVPLPLEPLEPLEPSAEQQVAPVATSNLGTTRALDADVTSAPVPAVPGQLEVEATGHYRIYLGAAAGVGKTVAMLEEGHRRHKRGADVVIGFVECHGRHLTEARTTGLEIVPRKVVDYRGVRVEEMDLDAVLRRRPQVALVDELAHSNVSGSDASAKRWQDVMALLDAKIDVITTVNIQHLESIADAVEQISGAPVRERVPDWVVRRADQIELVDSSPEALRRRMIHGNIYPPQKIDQALAHFFQVDNLIALRELALRFLADESEEVLIEHLRRHDPVALWETTERILVGATVAPGTDAIIRRASRMAARIKADLHVAHVVSTSGGSHRATDNRLAALRQVASDVGAEWSELPGDDPARGLIELARHHQITQIVLGSRQRSRWQELRSGGSVIKRVSRLAAEAGIDVHIIARRGPVA